MKFRLTLLLCLAFSVTIYAQQDTALVEKQREVGLNVTNFVNSFFSFNEQNSSPGNYLFSYRIYSKQGKIFRFGIDFDSNRLKETNEMILDDEKRRISRLVLRGGMERQVPLTKRWTLFLGYDLIGGIARNKFEAKRIGPNGSNSREGTTRSWNFGTGPCIGIQFNINDRLGLFTESTFYLNYSERKEISGLVNLGVFVPDIEKKSSSLGFDIGLPTAIFFFVKL